MVGAIQCSTKAIDVLSVEADDQLGWADCCILDSDPFYRVQDSASRRLESHAENLYTAGERRDLDKVKRTDTDWLDYWLASSSTWYVIGTDVIRTS